VASSVNFARRHFSTSIVSAGSPSTISTRHRKLHAACCAVASTQNIRPPDCLDSRFFLTANKLRIAKYSLSPISYKSQSSVPESKGTLLICTTVEKNSLNSHTSLPLLHPHFTSPALHFARTSVRPRRSKLYAQLTCHVLSSPDSKTPLHFCRGIVYQNSNRAIRTTSSTRRCYCQAITCNDSLKSSTVSQTTSTHYTCKH
jgi:hypothetical protein